KIGLFSRESPMHRGAPRRMKIGLFSREVTVPTSVGILDQLRQAAQECCQWTYHHSSCDSKWCLVIRGQSPRG
ncbi:hypothetical protein, partial [Candidatus Hakubella thermalkaliphila]|uniref:hypothetical protein n=1 Tax=Candidatus Hakubella thermalkaliphila TaxID=2754717 RepID=UPI001C613650